MAVEGEIADALVALPGRTPVVREDHGAVEGEEDEVEAVGAGALEFGRDVGGLVVGLGRRGAGRQRQSDQGRHDPEDRHYRLRSHGCRDFFGRQARLEHIVASMPGPASGITPNPGRFTRRSPVQLVWCADSRWNVAVPRNGDGGSTVASAVGWARSETLR